MPLWLNSALIPVSVIGLSGRKLSSDAQVVLGGVDAVGIEKDQPVRGTTLAEPVSELAHDTRQSTGWLRGAEHGGEEPMLDRPLTRPLLGLTLGEIPMSAGVKEFQLREPTGGPPYSGRHPNPESGPVARRCRAPPDARRIGRHAF